MTQVIQDGKEIWEWIQDFNVLKAGNKDSEETPIHLKDILIIDDEIYDIDRYYNDNYIIKCDPKKGFNKFKYWEALDKYRENLKLDELWVVDPVNNVPVKY